MAPLGSPGIAVRKEVPTRLFSLGTSFITIIAGGT
jgi:hypothetical protein